MNKKFHAWIKKEFAGLSPATLFQFAVINGFTDISVIDNDVFVFIYQYFCGKREPQNVQTYKFYKDMVTSCTWL